MGKNGQRLARPVGAGRRDFTRQGLGLLGDRLESWLTASRPVRAAVVREFHRLYYNSADQTWRNTYWLGTPVMKCPLDLWVYQEIVHRLRPSLIVETGTASGGSARYLASVCDEVRSGQILTIDIESPEGRPEHSRVEYLHGSSTAAETLAEVRRRATGQDCVMVILDSDHSYEHVREELRLYHELVTPGSYLIVEDTNLNGHPVLARVGQGPIDAVEEFVADDPAFQIDRSCEKFFMTLNPRGFLHRVGSAAHGDGR
jgi:cephalosporin hydroxylase